MLRTQIPLNSPAGRKITAVILVISLLLSLFVLSRSREFDRRVEAGELVPVQAMVEQIRITGRGEDREYDVWASYTYDGTNYENVELSWYTSEMEEGQPTTIYISPAAPDEPLTNSSSIFGYVVAVFFGCTLLCFAIAWFPRKKEAYP